jgi:hypothetical protein
MAPIGGSHDPLKISTLTSFFSKKSNSIFFIFTYFVALHGCYRLPKICPNRKIGFLEKWGGKVGVFFFERDYLMNERSNMAEISRPDVGLNVLTYLALWGAHSKSGGKGGPIYPQTHNSYT